MPDVFVAISKVSDGNMLVRDDLENPEVIKNRERFFKKNNLDMDQATRLHVDAAVRIVKQKETDWCRYRAVTSSDKGAGMRGDTFQSDAIVTTQKNHALFLPVADCVGTVFYDADKSVLMLAHLGRHSLEQDGGIKTVQYLVDHYKVDPANLKVWLTPAPSKEAYQIWALENKGMKEALFEQLEAVGITHSNIIDNTAETDKDTDYFSYTEFYNGRRNEDGDYAIVAMMT